jgi:hypothetical protein
MILYILGNILDDQDITILLGMLVVLVALAMCWWEFYAKPCRDSLKNIERALLSAPWMQQRSNHGMRRSA